MLIDQLEKPDSIGDNFEPNGMEVSTRKAM